MQMERDWYDQEEFGTGLDENKDPFIGPRIPCSSNIEATIDDEQCLGDSAFFEKRESEMQQRFFRRDGTQMTLAQSKRQTEIQRDLNAWEENRLLTSGIVCYKEVLASLHFSALLALLCPIRSIWISIRKTMSA